MPWPCRNSLTKHRGLPWSIAAVPLLLLLPPPSVAPAEDLVTPSDHQRYLDVHVERVDPDGVTYRHRLGMVKLCFEELPAPVRQAYHYDPQRAADFLRLQRERTEENARLVREAEMRREEAFARRQAQLAAAGPDPFAATTGAFAYSSTVNATGAGSARAAATSVDDQIQRWQAAEARRNDPSVWNDRNWKYLPALASPMEMRPTNGREDPFFTPNYAKRALDDLYHDSGPGVK